MTESDQQTLIKNNHPQSAVHDLSNYYKYKTIETILKLCGYSGYDDYTTMRILSDIKKEDGDLYISINKLLPAVDHIKSNSEIFTILRRLLTEECIPHEMVHKKNGNYLKLVEKKYTLANYFIEKSYKTEEYLSKGYLSYDAYLADDSLHIYRTCSDAHILCYLEKMQTFAKGPCGVIVNRRIPDLKAEPNVIIYESNNKYYMRHEILRTGDVMNNYKCTLSYDDIVISELNHIITFNGYNEIFDSSHDIPMISSQFCQFYLNVEISKEYYFDNAGCKITVTYDETYLSAFYRQKLICTSSFAFGTITGGIIFNTISSYLPLTYVLWCIDGKLRLHNAHYSEFRWHNILNERQYGDINVASGRSALSYHKISSVDKINVGMFATLHLKLIDGYKLSYNISSSIPEDYKTSHCDVVIIRPDMIVYI